MSKFEKFATAEKMLSADETKEIKGGVGDDAIVGWTCTCKCSPLTFSTPGTNMDLVTIFELCGREGAGCSRVLA
jgi:hypothetical protein